MKMTEIGTALTPSATKVLFLGAGELGKEVVIEMQRLGVEVIAVDYWDLFLDTGAPEAYLLYRDAQETVCKQEKQ